MLRFSNYVSESDCNAIGRVAKGKSIEDIANHHKVSASIIRSAIAAGAKVELEHTKNKIAAASIAKDHVWEDPKYYVKLKKIETNS